MILKFKYIKWNIKNIIYEKRYNKLIFYIKYYLNLLNSY